jgi:hypothetical protein
MKKRSWLRLSAVFVAVVVTLVGITFAQNVRQIRSTNQMIRIAVQGFERQLAQVETAEDIAELMFLFVHDTHWGGFHYIDAVFAMHFHLDDSGQLHSSPESSLGSSPAPAQRIRSRAIALAHDPFSGSGFFSTFGNLSNGWRITCIGLHVIDGLDGHFIIWAVEAATLPRVLHQLIAVYVMTALLLAALFVVHKKHGSSESHGRIKHNTL